jgi:hypothetical protein
MYDLARTIFKAARNKSKVMSEEILPSLAEESLNEAFLEEMGHINESDKPEGDPLSITGFDAQIAALTSAEEKLVLALQFMKTSLDQAGAPYFKGFWHARQLATNLFKETLNATKRVELWKNYRDLCAEFRKLKEVLDENAAFAAEQIEIAVKATTAELENLDEQIEKQSDIELPLESQTIEKNFKIYNKLQKELNLLNAYALRINALRKELIKTEMRIRVKNKFFKDLSLLGDKVFPKRKELIKALSQQFIDDVNQFINRNFKGKEVQGAFFFLREEIKALQSIAKHLTLNTHAFTSTRTHLSECWDLVKAADKDKKKELSEKRSLFKQNEEEVKSHIEKLKQAIIEGTVTKANLSQHLEDINSTIKSLELGKEERSNIKEALNIAQQPILEKIKQEEEEKAKALEAALKARQEKLEALKTTLENLIKEAANHEADALEAKKEEFVREYHHLNLTRSDKLTIEKSLKALKDIINEKHEKALLNLSEDDQSHLSKLKEALKDREKSRKEIKEHLDSLKKAKSSISVSFEKALSFNESIDEEKERLAKLESSIEDIQNKIKELSSKAKA